MNKEYPLLSYAAKVLSLAYHKGFTVYRSSICLAIAFYFCREKSGTTLAKQKMNLLAFNLSIAKVDSKEVLASLANKKVNDFEDGLVYYSAINSKCDLIITEDKNHFYFFEIEVLGCTDLFENI